MASASVFGQHALAYSVISYLLLSRQRQVVMYTMGQQTLVVLGGLLISQFVMAVCRMLAGGPWLAAAILSAVDWRIAVAAADQTALLVPQRRGSRA